MVTTCAKHKRQRRKWTCKGAHKSAQCEVACGSAQMFGHHHQATARCNFISQGNKVNILQAHLHPCERGHPTPQLLVCSLAATFSPFWLAPLIKQNDRVTSQQVWAR